MIKHRIHSFGRRDDGAMTVFGLFMFVTMVVIGGLALDVANAMMARTQLQVAADAVAHAALYSREMNDAEQAKITALALADVNMPASKYGTVLTADDIKFGYWDAAARQFEVDDAAFDSVFVDVSRMQSTANPVGTYFLRFVGIDQWDVRRGSVFETYIPTCFREGFVADEPVDIQSNNTYVNGFCIHSNTHVEMNNNNLFEDSTVVSMPDKRDVVLPSSGMDSNIGLESALRDGSYQIRILNRLPDIIDGLENLDDLYLPDYITSNSVITLGRNISDSDFTPHSVHVVRCRGGQHLQFSANAMIADVVLVTNCRINFASGATLDNAILATTYISTTTASISAGAEFTLGRDDHCAADGGAQILSLSTVDLSAGLNIFGGQIIAMDDIKFTAGANGIEGASLIAGGTISGTAGMVMGFCGGGMERNFQAEYFRLVN